MKLYDNTVAPNPRRVRICIAEKGLDIPKQEIDIRGGENLTDAYRKINPWGLVPALELDDGTVLTEVPCIFRYLEDLHPEPNLLGRDPKETAIIGAWERFSELNGTQAIGEFFRNQSEVFATRAVAGYAGTKAIPALVERGRERTAWYHAQIEQRLAGNTYLAGDSYTAADITALCAIDFGNRVGLPVPEGNTHTLRWHATVSARPSAAA